MKSKYGVATINYLAWFNNLEVFKKSVFKGADVNSTYSIRVYQLMLASKNSNLEMVWFLL